MTTSYILNESHSTFPLPVYARVAATGSTGSTQNQIWIYFGFVVLLFGIVGNLLTLAVSTRKPLRRSSTSNYLIIIAVGDLVLLIIGIVPDWLESMQVVVYDKVSPITCKLDKFCKYSFADSAIWITVLFTFDRCLAICYPLKKTWFSLPKSVKYLSGGALMLAFAKNLHVFWTRGAQYATNTYNYTINGTVIWSVSETILLDNCGYPRPAFAEFEGFVRPWIALVFTAIIPCTLLSTFNVLIVRAMVRTRKSPIVCEKESRKRADSVFQTSAMCLAGSISFLVCITPTIVLTVGKIYWTQQPNQSYSNAKAFNNVFFYVNYSINFFLYCLTGKKFRTTFFLMFSLERFVSDPDRDESDPSIPCNEAAPRRSAFAVPHDAPKTRSDENIIKSVAAKTSNVMKFLDPKDLLQMEYRTQMDEDGDGLSVVSMETCVDRTEM